MNAADRLRDAISGERAYWHKVEVQPEEGRSRDE